MILKLFQNCFKCQFKSVPSTAFWKFLNAFVNICFSQSPSEWKAFQQHCICVLFTPFPVFKLQSCRKHLPEASVTLHTETYLFSATLSSFLVSYLSLHLLLYFGIPILLFSGLWSQLIWGILRWRAGCWNELQNHFSSLETSHIFGNRSLKMAVSVCILNKKNLKQSLVLQNKTCPDGT